MLSVIICTYNRERYIIPLLESVVRNDFPHSEYEIVFIDNNSPDHTYERCIAFAKAHPDVAFRYIKETEQGVSAARNRGIHEAKGELLVCIDDDALVDTDYLCTYAQFFYEHPDAMAAGGRIEPLYETQEPKWMSHYTRELLTGQMNYGKHVRTYPYGRFPGGGNSAYRKEVFERVGYFNTALGRIGNNPLGAEEKDLFDKMRAKGIPFYYIPHAVLHHIIPQYKLEEDYFNQLTLRIGQSERLRTLAIGRGKYYYRLLQEGIKWCGTIVLLIAHTLCGKPQRGWKLVLFRKNVTNGLLGG